MVSEWWVWVRAAAADQGQSCVVPSAANIFVYPDQYEDIFRAVRHRGWQPHDVIIAEAFLPLLRADIAALPCKDANMLLQLRVRNCSDDAELSCCARSGTP